MRSERLRTIVEIGLCIALAAVLGMVKITLPWNIAGGSVSLTMLPLFVVALRRGLIPGIAAGILFGFVDYMMEPWFVHPVQVALDYPIAFGACGLAGLVAPLVLSSRRSLGPIALWAIVGTVVGGLGRFSASFVSGIVFFGQNARPGQPVWLYSLLYNSSYLLPSVVASAIVAAIVVPALSRAVPVRNADIG